MTQVARDMTSRMAEWAAPDTAEEPEQLVGQVLPVEGSYLRTLASKVQTGEVIVELGSYTGKSTVCLAKGSSEGAGVPVFAVDLWTTGTSIKGHSFETFDPERHEGQSQSKFHHPGAKAKFDHRVLQYDEARLVHPIMGEATDVGELWKGRPVGLLFIDAEHTGEAVQRDFNAWSTHVVGPVVFHDYKGGREGNGVRPVVDEIVAGPEWKFVQQGPGSIAVIRRQE